MIFVWIILGIMGWYVLGTIAFLVADPSEELIKWVYSAPNIFLWFLAFILWPVIIIVYHFRKVKE